MVIVFGKNIENNEIFEKWFNVIQDNFVEINPVKPKYKLSFELDETSDELKEIIKYIKVMIKKNRIIKT